MTTCNQLRPQAPFLVLHPKVIWRYGGGLKENYFYWINQRWYHEGVMKRDSYVLDRNCQKWPIEDVILVRKSFDLLSIIVPRWRKYWKFKVKYVYGSPVQLTFEEAKSEIIERACLKRWYRRLNLKEDAFREKIAGCQNTDELFYWSQYLGHDPPI
jgi:hypothetical protein